MRRLVHLWLILLLALSAGAVGHARGQVRDAQGIVLCGGKLVMTDAAGRQVLCPDMAPGLLAAIAAPPALPAVPEAAAGRFVAPPLAVDAVPAPAPAPSARGPPRLA